MNVTVQLSNKAIELRRSGYSYSEIASLLKVSKTSVSNWVKNVRLTESEKQHLQKTLKTNKDRTRMKISISLRAKKVFKEKKAYDDAEKEFAVYQKDPLFMLGVGLYWAHGAQKNNVFQFMSSDPQMMKLFTRWMDTYLPISREMAKYKLFVDFTCKDEGYEGFWSKSLGISQERFLRTSVLRSQNRKKSQDYRGSLSLVVANVEVFRKVIAWQKLTIRYYS